MTPLRTFRKAHTHDGAINLPPSPVALPPKAPSVDFNMSYVPTSPSFAHPSLPVDSNAAWAPSPAGIAWGQFPQPQSRRASQESLRSQRLSQDSVRSSEIPEDSPGIVWAEHRQTKRASQDSARSSFSAEHAVRAGGGGTPVIAPTWTPFAQNTNRLSQDTSSQSGDSDSGTCALSHVTASGFVYILNVC